MHANACVLREELSPHVRARNGRLAFLWGVNAVGNPSYYLCRYETWSTEILGDWQQAALPSLVRKEVERWRADGGVRTPKGPC
jgi:hypothetical protein